MRYVKSACLGLLAAAAIGVSAEAAVVIDQEFSSAPNIFVSPPGSFPTYAANALNSLRNGLGNIGDRNVNPTAYEQLNGIYTPGDIQATTIPSWRGQANPTGAFANEFGNRLHAGVVITSDVQFALKDVTFAFGGNDGSPFGPACPLGGLCFQGDLSGLDFQGGMRIGIDFGADNALGGGDDTVYDTANIGSDSVLINQLIYVGVGNAYVPLPIQSDMDLLSQEIIDADLVISNTYCVRFGTAPQVCETESVRLASVPEPVSASMLALGLAALVYGRRRRTRASTGRERRAAA